MLIKIKDDEIDNVVLQLLFKNPLFFDNKGKFLKKANKLISNHHFEFDKVEFNTKEANYVCSYNDSYFSMLFDSAYSTKTTEKQFCMVLKDILKIFSENFEQPEINRIGLRMININKEDQSKAANISNNLCNEGIKTTLLKSLNGKPLESSIKTTIALSEKEMVTLNIYGGKKNITSLNSSKEEIGIIYDFDHYILKDNIPMTTKEIDNIVSFVHNTYKIRSDSYDSFVDWVNHGNK